MCAWKAQSAGRIHPEITGKKRKREDKYTDIMNIIKEDIDDNDKNEPK